MCARLSRSQYIPHILRQVELLQAIDFPPPIASAHDGKSNEFVKLGGHKSRYLRQDRDSKLEFRE